jgi:curved DNA-binding protein CbpA
MSAPAVDYYQILALPKDASFEDGARIICLFPIAHAEPGTVRRAYKQKVLETHPDKLPPDSTEEEKGAAREQFSKVGYVPAFSVLS